MMILVTNARRVVKKSCSSARSRCLRINDRLRTGDRNKGAVLCLSLSALASPMAIRFKTRLEDAPSSAARLRTERSTAIAGLERLQELHANAFLVMAHHPGFGLAQLDQLSHYGPHRRLQQRALEGNVQHLAWHRAAIGRGEEIDGGVSRLAAVTAQPGKSGHAMFDEDGQVLRQFLDPGFLANEFESQLALDIARGDGVETAEAIHIQNRESIQRRRLGAVKPGAPGRQIDHG